MVMFDVVSWLNSGAILSLGPNEYLLSYGKKQSSQEPLKEPSYYAPDFYLTAPEPWVFFSENVVVTKKQLNSRLQSFLSAQPQLKSLASICNWQNPDKTLFIEVFQKIQSFITSQQLKKAVPVVFETTQNTLPPIEQAQVLLRLLCVNEQHIYGLWSGGQGVLGVTPEILLYIEPGALQSMALAGTGLCSEAKGSLLTDQKEMQEHNIVVESLLNSLTKYGEPQQSSTYEWQLNPLKHLRTDITVPIKTTLNTAFIEELVTELHPTPALGVAPKSFPWKNMQQFDSEPRQCFGAPFAVKQGGEFKSVVAIRNIIWDQKQIKIGSGCGIVSASQLDKEWNELMRKRSSVKHYMGF